MESHRLLLPLEDQLQYAWAFLVHLKGVSQPAYAAQVRLKSLFSTNNGRKGALKLELKNRINFSQKIGWLFSVFTRVQILKCPHKKFKDCMMMNRWITWSASLAESNITFSPFRRFSFSFWLSSFSFFNSSLCLSTVLSRIWQRCRSSKEAEEEKKETDTTKWNPKREVVICKPVF